MDEVLLLKIVVHFDGWNDAHRRGLRVELTKFSTRGGGSKLKFGRFG